MSFTPACDNAFGNKVQFSEVKEEMHLSDCLLNHKTCQGRRCSGFCESPTYWREHES